MGFTSFSYELFVGTLLVPDPYNPQSWILGFLANLVVGSIFGLFYGYCFEYIFFRATPRFGVQVGFWHAVIAAIAFFPFFGAIHEFMGRDLYPDFGLLGIGMETPTPILIVVGTLMFGASMGLFYGPVRSARVRARIFEPGETDLSVEEGRISAEEDNRDQRAVYHE